MTITRSQPLYLISDGGTLRHFGKLVSAVESALRGGEGRIFAVQIREQKGGERDASDTELRQIASELLPICREHQARLVLNRHVALAAELGVGVHLGANSESLSSVEGTLRATHGAEQFVIGYSAHTVEELESLAPSYFFYSPIFNPLSKSSSREPIGIEGLRAGIAVAKRPVFALGGITPENIGEVRNAGAAGGAVITSVLLAPSPNEAAKRFLDAWDGIER